MENIKKRDIKNNKGITLIALVVTIIVLLILAGISISMIFGENSIIQKAIDAKQITERSEAKEQAKIDILAYVADKTANHQDASLDDEKIQEILSDNKSYVKEANATSFITTKGGYEIAYSELYTAINNDTDTVDATRVAEINSKIGTIVTGYSANDLEWQVFYSDTSETFLISKTLVNTVNYDEWSSRINYYPIPTRGENRTTDYIGTADVRNSTYGKKWNSKWLAKCISDESTRENAKRIAYLCDPDNWEAYKVAPALYAVGGPTMELLMASWNVSQQDNLEIADEDVTVAGYYWNKPSKFFSGLIDNAVLTENINNGVYNPGDNYWIASPAILIRHDEYVNYVGNGDDILSFRSCRNIDWSNQKDKGYTSSDTYYYHGQFWDEPNNKIRPIVSIPTSKISVNGEIITVLP